jgi:hypothetical protein
MRHFSQIYKKITIFFTKPVHQLIFAIPTTVTALSTSTSTSTWMCLSTAPPPPGPQAARRIGGQEFSRTGVKDRRTGVQEFRMLAGAHLLGSEPGAPRAKQPRMQPAEVLAP